MNSTPVSRECGSASTRSARSSRSSTGQTPGLRQSPHTFSRGNTARSRSNVFNPAFAQSAAQVAPAGPAPTTATSYALTTSPPLNECFRDGVRHHFATAREHGAIPALLEKTEFTKLGDRLGPAF